MSLSWGGVDGPAACFLRMISAADSLALAISEPLRLFLDFYSTVSAKPMITVSVERGELFGTPRTMEACFLRLASRALSR